MQVRVKELSFSYGHKQVLDTLSFEVSPGEVVGVLGVNGAGKSTLLKLLCGLVPVQSGSIESVKRERLGVVFQECSLDPKLTGFDNLRLFSTLFGRKLRPDFRVSGVDLKQPVKNLSGGMKRRLELARVFVHEPELVLMDEPTTGLDLRASEDFWADLKIKKTTVILNTHKAEEAERCDRLLLIHEGKILLSETPGMFKSRVSEDRITLKFKDQTEKQILSVEGHQLVPRLVETYPVGSIESIEVRAPSLADAFLKVTGVSLS